MFNKNIFKYIIYNIDLVKKRLPDSYFMIIDGS